MIAVEQLVVQPVLLLLPLALMMMNLPRLVLDGGSMFFKAGFAGDDAPRAVFPSVVTGSPIPNTAFIRSARNGFVGDEAIANQNCFYLEHPIQRGLITDWDQMEKVFYYNNSYYSTQLLYTFSDLASYFLQQAACGTRGAPSSAHRCSRHTPNPTEKR